MYKEHFHLRTYPFENTPDPLFYYNSSSHREALASMVYGVREAKGFILISGDVGTGKTTLVQALKQELGEAHLVVEIASPWISSKEAVSVLRTRLGVPQPEEDGEHALMEALKKKLLQFDGEGKRVVLVVDEAHLLPEHTLEGIRLLSNIETGQRKLIQIIFLGQDELVAHLSRYSLRQLNQRIALRFHLGRLALPEAGDYIRFRLRVAGGSETLFTPESIELIAHESGGVPRLINLICDNALLVAYGQSLSRVDAAVVAAAVERMRPPGMLAADTVDAASAGFSPQAGTGRAGGPVPPVELPFATQMPAKPVPPAGPEKHEFPYLPREMPKRANSNLWPMLAIGGLLALVIGALFVWWAMRGPDDRSAPAQMPPPPAQDTVVERAETQPKIEQAPASESMPVPFAPGAGVAKEVTVQKPGDIQAAAVNLYGTWNETAEDIVLTANPALTGAASQSADGNIMLPQLSRKQMVVQGRGSEYFIYYASFKDHAQASAAVDALKEVWHNALVSPAAARGGNVYRVFIGSFTSKDMAESVVRSIWFKYLPAIN